MLDKIRFFMSSVFDFLLPFIKILMVRGGEIVTQIAYDVVRDVAVGMPGATGEEKRAAAFAMIRDRLISEGMELSTSIINAVLEAAVLKLKSQQ